MNCLEHKEIADIARGTIDSQNRQSLLAHIETCQKCHKALDEERKIVGAIKQALVHTTITSLSSCPHDETLALLIDNALSINERNKLESHLASCAKCRETLVDMHLALEMLLEHELSDKDKQLDYQKILETDNLDYNFWRDAR